MADKTLRRLPLRQLLASSDRTTRDLADLVHTHFLARIADFRELSRPIRRKSSYPTMMAFQNGLRRLLEANEQLKTMVETLQDHLDAIRDHANREKINRQR